MEKKEKQDRLNLLLEEKFEWFAGIFEPDGKKQRRKHDLIQFNIKKVPANGAEYLEIVLKKDLVSQLGWNEGDTLKILTTVDHRDWLLFPDKEGLYTAHVLKNGAARQVLPCPESFDHEYKKVIDYKFKDNKLAFEVGK